MQAQYKKKIYSFYASMNEFFYSLFRVSYEQHNET